MKKFFMVLLILISCFCSAFMISACNKKEDVGQQTTQTQPSDKDNGNIEQTPPSDKDNVNSGQTPPVHTHSMSYHAQVGASCTVAGIKEYWSCSGCGKNFADSNGKNEINSLTIPATGHKKVPHEKKDATCTQAGWAAYETCENCDYTTYKEIPATSHNLVDGICSVCKLDTNKYVTVENVLDPTDYLKLKIESDNHIKLPVDITTNPKATHYFRYYYDRYQNEQVTDFTFTESTKIYVRIFNINLTNYNFSVANGKATLTKASDWQKNQQLVIIPRQYNGLPVTAIGESAFLNGQMQEVIMLDEVTTIENRAFYGCGGLTSVTISKNVTNIHDFAFAGCSSLTSVYYTGNIDGWCQISGLGDLMSHGASAKKLFINGQEIIDLIIPDSVISIGKSAFKSCGLTSVTISKSVTNIGVGAFSSCGSLKSVTIPKNVIKIGGGAFNSCDSLTTVNWNATNCTSAGSVEYDRYDDDIFRKCKNLTTLNIGDNVTTIPKNAFRSCSSLKSVTIPENVESIGDNAFAYCSSLTTVNWNATACLSAGTYNKQVFVNCSNLTTVNMGNNVTVIPAYAFSGCYNLTDIDIPESIISVGYGAFQNCNNLQYNELNNLLYLGNSINPYVILMKAKNKAITSVDIDKNVKCVYAEAFTDCSSLTSIEIPNSVTDIGAYAFYGCNSLTSVNIPESVTSIYQSMFEYCNSLTSITIPDSVTSIGYRAFRGCTSLTSIIIPNSVTNVGGYAFIDCNSLKAIYCEAKNKPKDWNEYWQVKSENNAGEHTYHYVIWSYKG